MVTKWGHYITSLLLTFFLLSSMSCSDRSGHIRSALAAADSLMMTQPHRRRMTSLGFSSTRPFPPREALLKTCPRHPSGTIYSPSPLTAQACTPSILRTTSASPSTLPPCRPTAWSTTTTSPTSVRVSSASSSPVPPANTRATSQSNNHHQSTFIQKMHHNKIIFLLGKNAFK